ncbi:hypothetical protein ACQJBY_057572 [Aegilops geniculata]
MEFLMHPVNRTLIEKVNDSDIPMEPLRYPVLPMLGGELPAASATSADALICSATAVGTGEGADRPQASEHSVEQGYPQAPGWTRRVRIGAAAPGRAPNPDRMTALEKSVHVFAEAPGENVIVPKIGINFDTLGEAYDFYNLYSWEKGFGIRYGKSRVNVSRTKCMQEIVCGCAGKLIVENTRSCRCECPALVRLLRSKDNGWYIAEHRDEHNHSLSPTYGQTLH